MKCCNNKPKFIECFDNPNTGFAWNLYLCEECGSLFKEDVWENKGIIKITPDNKIK